MTQAQQVVPKGLVNEEQINMMQCEGDVIKLQTYYV